MSEKNLWVRVKKGLKNKGLFERCESTLVGRADVNYLIEGTEGWIELKHGDKPVRPSTVVFRSQRGLEPEQINWLLTRIANKGKAWVLAQVGTSLFLIHGSMAPSFNHMTFSDMDSAASWALHGNATERDWEKLAAVLRNYC